MKKIALILAGGRGKRFWPHSRFNKPKQLLPSPSGNTMLRETFERLLPFFEFNDIFISTTEDLFQQIREIVPEVDLLNYVLEPTGRDTAASIALSALLINNYYKNTSIDIAIFPIDHYIPEKNLFQNSLKVAFQVSSQFSKPVLIGLKPKKKEPRYGYIVVNKQISSIENIKLYEIMKFKEKPDENWITENEKKYQLFWNTGIYVMPSHFIFQSVRKFLPDLNRSMQIISQNIGTLDKSQAIRTQFEKIKAVSFEYAILEKTLEILLIDGGFVWDDIGSWHAVERFIPLDPEGNIIQGEHLGIDTNNCIIINDNGLTVTIGLDNYVIIKNGSIQMIYPKNREGDIKKIISQMEKNNQFKKYL